MKRIYVQNMGSDTTKIPQAIAVGIRECKALGTSALTLITPAKDNLDSIVVGEFLGAEASKKLMKGQAVGIGNTGFTIRHESAATVRKAAAPKVALAFYVSEDVIGKLDDLQFECLIFVPWLDEDGKRWAAKWNAETLHGHTEGATIDLKSEVVDALKDLTATVNLSTGLAHLFDKERAKRKFSQLRSQRVRWEPSELEKWAARNGWRAADAKELSDLSAKYL